MEQKINPMKNEKLWNKYYTATSIQKGKFQIFEEFFFKMRKKHDEYFMYQLRFFIITREKFFENLKFALLKTGSK
jgi:hypothetical protein